LRASEYIDFDPHPDEIAHQLRDVNILSAVVHASGAASGEACSLLSAILLAWRYTRKRTCG
jgi:hypothetical protein